MAKKMRRGERRQQGRVLREVARIIAQLEERIWKLEQVVRFNGDLFRVPPTLKARRRGSSDVPMPSNGRR